MVAIRSLLAALTILALPGDLFAQPRAPSVTDGTVLFVCEHGTVKSLLAKLLFDEYAAQIGLSMRAESRGTTIDSVVPPWMRAHLDASRLTYSGFTPRTIAPRDLARASVVVTFDLPATVSVGTRGARTQWDSLPPASQQFEASRDAIKARVHALADSLNHARPARRP